MTTIERTAYPRFGNTPSRSELARLYTPTLREIELAKKVARGEQRPLVFLVMFKSFQRLGYFPAPEEVPEPIFSCIRSRLGLEELPESAPAKASAVPERSLRHYRDAIREYLEVRSFGDEARRIAVEAVTASAATMDDPADLVNVAIEELIKERFELPSFTSLDRMVRHMRHAVNSRLFARVDERLSARQRRRLDALLMADTRGWGGRSELTKLKTTPKSATKKNLSELQENLIWLESFGDTARLLEGIPNQKVANLAAQGRALDASELKDVGYQRRRAMLACLLDRSKILARDGLAGCS